MGSGVILEEVIKGAELLKQDFGVDADIWSVTSFNLLHRDLPRSGALQPFAPAGRSKSCRLLPANCKAMKAR
jgi:pyruvate dehydrogenase E1 component